MGAPDFQISNEQIDRFREDGFLIVESFLDEETVQALRNQFEPLFRGEFETGLYPDEWNWREGRDSPELSRQICNGWKSNRILARTILSENVGYACARLAGWPGARIAQDNVLWKAPGSKSLGYHQDDSYILWVDPPGYVTCWMPLDDTTREGGTIEYVRGSHLWPLSKAQPEYFHAPDDYRAPMMEAAMIAGVSDPEIVQIEIPAGGCVFHAGRTWHGSGPNLADVPRRSVVSHCVTSESRFHPTNNSYIYSRYRKAGSLEFDEAFFPVLWHETNGRSAFLDDYLG